MYSSRNLPVFSKKISAHVSYNETGGKQVVPKSRQLFTSLKIGRSLVRFSMVSFEFFSDIILPVAVWP